MIETRVSGKNVMVFKNEDKGFPIYKASMGKKNKDGTGYDNAYKELKFKKGVELNNKDIINITNGFDTFRQWEKDGKKFYTWYYMILDFELVSSNEEEPETIEDNFSAIEEDVPF